MTGSSSTRRAGTRGFPTAPSSRAATFPSRDELIAYLDAYALRHSIDVRLGVRVERIEREFDSWRLVTSEGERHAEHVVVAGGYEHRPHVPAWAGRARFRGELLHAAAYRSPDAYAGRDVLVVGPGCSGAEIAFDLAEGGARRVRLAVRTPPNIIVRDPVGAPLATFFHKLPPQIGDAVMRFVRAKKVGDLSEYGLPAPEEGVFSRLKRLHVAPMIVDAEVLQAIRDAPDRDRRRRRGLRRDRRAARRLRADRAGRRDRRHRLPHRAGGGRRAPRRARRPRRAARDPRRGRAGPALRRLRPASGAAALRRREASRAAKAIARTVKPVPPTRLEAARAVR